jgi:hypothetical protein
LYRYDFILSDLKNTRGPEKASAWVGLGHFLHLLQDLTSPAHTRVDAHPHVPFAPSIDDPSKLEVLGKIKAGPLPLPQEGLITSFTDAKSAFTELRNWVVSNFYSEKNTNVPNYTSPSGPIGTLGADGYVRNGQRKIAYFDFLQSFLLNRQIYTINDVIALEQFDELAVAAIRWTASMMNFIHEKEGADGKGVPICEEQLVVQTTGKGTVTSSPNGISCGTTCDYYFPAGRSVTLVAFPASSSDPFLEWTGDIDPAKCPPKQTTCVVEMNDDKPKNVVANFDSVQVASIGAGTHFIHYTQNGTSCGAPVDTSGDFTVFFGPITLRKSLKLEIRDNGWLPATVTEAGVTSWGLGSSTYTSSISAAGIVTTSESGGKSSEDGVNRTGSSTETIDLNTGEYTWFRTISASFGCTSFVETQDRKATLPVTLN